MEEYYASKIPYRALSAGGGFEYRLSKRTIKADQSAKQRPNKE